MTSGSLFSGIGGFDLGFRDAGIKTLWMAEKEPFCQAILKTRFTEAQLFDDVAHVTSKSARAVDVLTAGFPCQDLSVAGKRAGLEGARSGLFWEVCRVLREFIAAGKPIEWFVLENVPGLFSSCEGRDFAVVLNALDELGYGLAWRVLNSQFFGVAQRRRRVFIVGRFGKPCPQEVLFESESGGGDFAESGEAWPDVAVPLTSGLGVTGNSAGRRNEDDYNLVPSLMGSGAGMQRTAGIESEPGYCIVQQAISSKWAKGSSGPAGDEHHNLTVCGTLGDRRGPGPEEAGSNRLVGAPAYSNRVRNFASLPEGLDSALPAGMDSARYRALGNAVTASVAKWIGERIVLAHGRT